MKTRENSAMDIYQNPSTTWNSTCLVQIEKSRYWFPGLLAVGCRT